MIKAIIFDFFDVIRSDQYNVWLKKHGFTRDHTILQEAQEKLDAGKLSPEAFLETLGKLSGEELTIEKLEEGATVNHDVLSIIQTLRKNYKIVVVSNAPSEFFRTILKKHDLENYFDEIIVSSEVGHIKPSPEIFEIALNRLNVSAAETIFIDDNKIYLAGAEKIGIKGIHFINANQLKKDLTDYLPDFV